MPRTATLGQHLTNDALPPDLRDYTRRLDAAGMQALLRQVAQQHPEQYRDISYRLSQLGRQAAYWTGGNTFGLEHLRMLPLARKRRADLTAKLAAIDDDDSLSDTAREQATVAAAADLSAKQGDEIYHEGLLADNPLAHQVRSGVRGNKTQLASLLGSDLLYMDHHDKTIPVPVLRGYPQGLDPAEYWAGTYGARKGVLSTKLATQSAGFLSKQLAQIAHRFIITGLDDDRPDGHLRGLPVDTGDPDNEGALLARDTGDFKRNARLTPKVLQALERGGHKRLLVRSPVASGAPDGGLYARDVGVRERGGLPAIGENAGLSAVQAMSEPLSQAQLSKKHGGGVFSGGQEHAVSGFAAINQLIQSPKSFQGGATHAVKDGSVEAIEPAPAGGHFIHVGGEKHFVSPGATIRVQKGDNVEAGDALTDGWQNPAALVEHKGIGEGRRMFLHAYKEANKSAGIKVHRRNAELLSRGLINHVRLTDEVGDGVPGDVVPYNTLEHHYEPRLGFQAKAPREAIGKYLERPYLHHTIGTQVRKSMLQDFDDFGVKSIDVHDEPPPFEPVMVRGMSNLQHDPDFMTRMLGSGLKGSLLDAVHRGGESDASGTSFVPALANPSAFGRQGKIQPPHKPFSLLEDPR